MLAQEANVAMRGVPSERRRHGRSYREAGLAAQLANGEEKILHGLLALLTSGRRRSLAYWQQHASGAAQPDASIGTPEGPAPAPAATCCTVSTRRTSAPAPVAPVAPSHHVFHHLHLNDSQWPFLLRFYERLFDPAATTRVEAGDVDGLRSGSMLLLINRALLRQTSRVSDLALRLGVGVVGRDVSGTRRSRSRVGAPAPAPPFAPASAERHAFRCRRLVSERLGSTGRARPALVLFA